MTNFKFSEIHIHVSRKETARGYRRMVLVLGLGLTSSLGRVRKVEGGYLAKVKTGNKTQYVRVEGPTLGAVKDKVLGLLLDVPQARQAPQTATLAI
jgi:hypothetical protein